MKPTKKQTIVAALAAAGAAVLIALVANLGPVCEEVQNPIARAFCHSAVKTAQEAQAGDAGTP